MRLSKILFFFSFFLLFTGCGKNNPVPAAPITPESHQASFVESYSSAEVIIRARGEGSSVQNAINDAKKAAIWFVLYGGDNPILKTAQSRKNFADNKDYFYKNVDKYITYVSDIKGKKQIGNKYYIDLIIRVNTNFLHDDLVAKNIIKDVITSGDNLPSVAVVPLKNNTLNTYAAGVVSEYLIDGNFDVDNITSLNVDKTFYDVAKNLTGNPIVAKMYANALSSGSDVYITINANVNKEKLGDNVLKKATVVINAYYTATNKKIGSTVGYSPARTLVSPQAIVAEATNDAADKVIGQITKAWIRESKKGHPYKVVITTNPDKLVKIKKYFYDALKNSCGRVIPKKSVYNMVDYVAYCKNINSYQDLEDKIINSYKGPGKIEESAAKGSFLLLKIKTSSDDMEIQ